VRKYQGFLLGALVGALPSFAAATTDSEVLLAKMEAKTEELELELVQMRTELAKLKGEKTPKPIKTAKSKAKPAAKSTTSPSSQKTGSNAESSHDHTLLRNLLGIPVVSSPYYGLRAESDNAELLVNISSINEDLRLLQQHQKLHDYLDQYGAEIPDHPIIELSGKIEAGGNVQVPYTGTANTNGAITLNSADLQVSPIINRWVFGFMSLRYDGSPSTLGQIVSNSRFFLAKGFITVGNLPAFPIYGTIGQLFMPFGRYSSHMLSAPLPQQIGRTLVRGVVAGYQLPSGQGPFAQVFSYLGDSISVTSVQGGANLGYVFTLSDKVSGEAAVSFISTMADSDDAQFTGASGGPLAFTGFGFNSTSEGISRRVPAIDVNAKLSLGAFDFAAEYLQAVGTFGPNDLTHNGHEARPMALHVEGNYSWNAWQIPTGIALSYGFTDDGFALNLPRHRMTTALNMAWWKNTIQTLEYRYSWNYTAGTTGAGRNGLGVLVPVPTNGTGGVENLITAQFGIYF
jgi:hypothetical protein